MKNPRPLPRFAPALAAVLLIGLSACNTKPTDITGPDTDDQKAALAHAKPVELPPSIEATTSYRCKDLSTPTIDWFSGGKSANVHAVKGAGNATLVKADAAGQTLTAPDGTTLDGTVKDKTIKLKLPGKDAQSCNS